MCLLFLLGLDPETIREILEEEEKRKREAKRKDKNNPSSRHYDPE